MAYLISHLSPRKMHMVHTLTFPKTPKGESLTLRFDIANTITLKRERSSGMINCVGFSFNQLSFICLSESIRSPANCLLGKISLMMFPFQAVRRDCFRMYLGTSNLVPLRLWWGLLEQVGCECSERHVLMRVTIREDNLPRCPCSTKKHRNC